MSLHPTEFDVLCGRGKHMHGHTGNCVFRRLVASYVGAYTAAKDNKVEKSKLVTKICEEVRKRGEFVKQTEEGVWIRVTDRMAREKVGQVLRDLLHCLYKSSSQAKQRKRKMAMLRQTQEIMKSNDGGRHNNHSDSSSSSSSSSDSVNAVVSSVANTIVQQTPSDRFVLELFSSANFRILSELKRQQLATVIGQEENTDSTTNNNDHNQNNRNTNTNTTAGSCRPLPRSKENRMMKPVTLAPSDWYEPRKIAPWKTAADGKATPTSANIGSPTPYSGMQSFAAV